MPTTRRERERAAMYINPDHFLQTEAGRVITPERNRAAWAESYRALEAAVRSTPAPSRVYVLVGPQGSGKSTWAKRRLLSEERAVFFDAILVKRSERAEVVARVKPSAVPVIAV